jgi:3-deoxy-7-phosphoheptulonate synthase
VEFFRHLQNPIGVKIGATMQSEEFVHLVRALNPFNEKDRLIVYTRFGTKKI